MLFSLLTWQNEFGGTDRRFPFSVMYLYPSLLVDTKVSAGGDQDCGDIALFAQ